MPSLIGLLPTDLQIWIIHTWLVADGVGTSPVQALSALDVACCSRGLRPTFMKLLELLPPFLDKPIHLELHVTKISGYLHWLASRHLAVQTLFLRERTGDHADFSKTIANLQQPLESIQSLLVEPTSRFECSFLLDVCPNLTAFSCKTDCAKPMNLAINTLATNTKQLVTLDLVVERAHNMTVEVDLDQLAMALWTNGPKLTTLRVLGVQLSPPLMGIIAKHRCNVHTLAICAFGMPPACIIRLASDLKELTTIRLEQFSNDEAVITQVLQGLDRTRIKSFSVSSPPLAQMSALVFARLLAAHADMEYFEVDELFCNRITEHLTISLRDLPEAALYNVLSVTPVTKLSVYNINYSAIPEAVVVLGMIAGTLTDLALGCCTEKHLLIAFLSKCSNLKRVILGFMIDLDKDVMAVLNNCCKCVEYMAPYGMMNTTNFVKLLHNYPSLTEVKLEWVDYFTDTLLQAVADSGSLTTVLCMRRKLTAKENKSLVAFQELVRMKQRLPMPRILMYDSVGVYELGH